MSAPATVGAILLAGGRASRVGGATKPLFEVGGETLLSSAVGAAMDAGASPIIVVGEVLDECLNVDWIREDPPFGGPVAGAVAALEQWRSVGVAPEWTLLLACDLPAVRAAAAQLSAALMLLPSDSDGVCLGDASSRPQWLTGLYRTRALTSAASVVADHGANAAVRHLVNDLAVTVLNAPDYLTDDVDTWEDLATARARRESENNEQETR
ncbi:molybdenum cofactor guanylyltransferase (plasmid) [Coraliomargarita sp. W4R53]